MAALWLFLKPFLPYLIAAGLILGAFGALKLAIWNSHRTGVNEGKQIVQADWDADKLRRASMVTEITNLWNDQRLRADELARQLEAKRNELFQPLHERAKALPAGVAAVRVPAGAAGVLDDAIRASAAAASTGQLGQAPAGAAAPSETTLGLLIDWGVTCTEMYKTALDRVAEWAKFYDGLRAAKPGGATP